MAVPVDLNARTFTFSDLTIGTHSKREKYRRRDGENMSNVHWGQRKLLISEIEFFTIYWDPKLIPNPICVYAGASPGTHIVMLSKMFPAFIFHLYDPRPFGIKATDKIILYNQKFTDEVAVTYANRKDIFFLSDIRTSDYRQIAKDIYLKYGIKDFDKFGNPYGANNIVKPAKREVDRIHETNILGDMNMQQQWVMTMNPEHALLKFRLPYPYTINDKMDTMQYLSGIVYWQPWVGKESVETRLKPIKGTGGYEQSVWNLLENEEWAFYHNTVEREQNEYFNIFTGTNDSIDDPELLNDYDSVGEAFILRLYFQKLGIEDPEVLYINVKKLSRTITLILNNFKAEGMRNRTLTGERELLNKAANKNITDPFRKKETGTEFIIQNPVIQPIVQTQPVTQPLVPILGNVIPSGKSPVIKLPSIFVPQVVKVPSPTIQSQVTIPKVDMPTRVIPQIVTPHVQQVNIPRVIPPIIRLPTVPQITTPTVPQITTPTVPQIPVPIMQIKIPIVPRMANIPKI
jgi:hypothetical protein